MSVNGVNGIGAAGYPTAGYETKKSESDMAGVNPFPMNRISTALVLHVESGQQGLRSTFLGDSVCSAKSMAEKIIHRLENPMAPAANPVFAGQELIFYKKFLEFLG